MIRTFSRVMANGSQAVIAPSEKTKQALLQYGVIAPIYIVPTGLDLSEYDRKNLDENRVQSIREELGFTSEDRIVVFVGRIAKEKAIEIPIEAISKNNDPHLHLVIVGGGTIWSITRIWLRSIMLKIVCILRVRFLRKILPIIMRLSIVLYPLVYRKHKG